MNGRERGRGVGLEWWGKRENEGREEKMQGRDLGSRGGKDGEPGRDGERRESEGTDTLEGRGIVGGGGLE